MNGAGVKTVKEAGKIAKLESLLVSTPVEGTTGIAHTRWATHGPPNQKNAHPHMSQDGTHRGGAQRDHRERHRPQADARGAWLRLHIGHRHRGARPPHRGVLRRQPRRRGARGALAGGGDVRHRRDLLGRRRSKIVAARKGSPLVIGVGDKRELRRLRRLGDPRAHAPGRLPRRRRDGRDRRRRLSRHRHRTPSTIHKKVAQIDWDLAQIEKGGYAHFMLKEIFEQPKTVENTMRGRLLDDEGDVEARRSQPERRRAPLDRPHRHHRLRHVAGTRR